jgi:hypothetical protein
MVNPGRTSARVICRANGPTVIERYDEEMAAGQEILPGRNLLSLSHYLEETLLEDLLSRQWQRTWRVIGR